MFGRMEIGILGRGRKSHDLSPVRELALKLALMGVVFTRDDGSIKVVAEGPEENLIDFEDRLSKTSFFVATEGFYAKWHEPKGEFQDFSVTGAKK